MADSPILPGARAWRDGAGKPLPVEFYQFLRDLVRFVAETDGNTASLADVLARLSALEGSAGSAGSLTGPFSVAVFGVLASGALVQLVNDSDAPGNTAYYGTNASGVKGWHPIPTNSGGVLPLVTGEVPPVLVYLDDGSLVYSGV